MGNLLGGVRTKLKEAVTAGDWERVKSLAADDGLRQDELEGLACVYDSERDRFRQEHFKIILQSCKNEKVESVFKCILREKLWRSVGAFLERGVEYEWREKAVRSALEHAEVADLSNILPECTAGQFDEVLQAAVTRGIWGAVGGLLERRKLEWVWIPWPRQVLLSHANDEQREQALYAAIKDKGVENQHLCLILRCCAVQPSLRDRCLQEAVIRDLWLAVHHTLMFKLEAKKAADSGLLRNAVKMTGCFRLQTDWLDDLDKKVLTQVLERADQDTLMKHYLPFCSHDMAPHVLKKLATRKFWRAALSVLLSSLDTSRSGADQPSPSREDGQQAATQGSQFSDIYADSGKMFDLILKECVRRELWGVVSELQKHGLDQNQCTLVTEMAREHSGVCGSSLLVSRHGPTDPLQSVLALLDTTGTAA